jgi:predicted DNA binding CopG/RHH family protein
VKAFLWNPRKNEQLKADRGVSLKSLSRYEKQVLSAFEAGKLKSTITSEASLRRYRAYARATLSKNKRVNVRLSTPDLSEIQARAAEEGVPYQTLIASVLHKFVAGRFLEKSSRLAARTSGRGKKRRAA